MASLHPYLDWPGPIAFAHRGGALETIENTMQAFSYAVGLGYRYLETDVHVTADGVVVAFHDQDLQRSCELEGEIGSYTWADLKAARVNGSGQIPRLEELFEAFPDARLNIDAKSDQVVPGLCATLLRHNALDRVCIGSFSDRRLVSLRRELGERLCTSLGPAQVAALRVATRPAGRGQAAQVPAQHRGIPVVTSRFIEAAHRHRIAVHVWTIDDAAEMNKLLDMKVDGIMTDRPSLLKQVLIERGQWHE
jgi:glycerophosphoryl diester phosphodiesterase